MDKIKKIFRPGEDKSDDVKYGTPTKATPEPHSSSPHAESAAKTAMYGSQGSGSENPAHLETKSDAAKGEHGIMSQLTNPDGTKHDSTRYGETATAVPGTTLSRLQDLGAGGSNMSVLSGVTGPYANKADNTVPAASSGANTADLSKGSHMTEADTTKGQSEGLAATSPSETKPSTGGYEGGNYSTDPSSSLGGEAPGTSSGNKQALGDIAAIKPSRAGYNDGQSGNAGRASMEPTQMESSHIGRDTAVGGAAATGLGAAGYAATKDHDSSSQGLGSSTAERATPSAVSGIPSDSTKDASDSLGFSDSPYTDNKDSATSMSTADSTQHQRSTSSTMQPETGSLAGGSVRPDTTTGTTAGDSSHIGRDAAIGTGAGAAGAMGVGGIASQLKDDKPDDDISRATHTERSFPLGGGATSSEVPDVATSQAPPAAPAPISSSGAPTGTTHSGTTGLATDSSPSTVRDTANQEVSHISGTSSSHGAYDSAIAGAGALGAGALGAGGLAAYEKEHEPKDDISAATYTARSFPVGGSSESGPTDPSSASPTAAGDEGRSFLPPSSQAVPAMGGHSEDERPVEGYMHHAPGPHATDIANRLDPHVPGEFPTEDGLDRHDPGAGSAVGAGTAAGLGGAGLAAGGALASSRDDPSSLDRHDPGTGSGIGAGTAAGLGGAGLATGGALASSRDDPSSMASPPSPSTGRHPSELMGMPETAAAPQESNPHAVRHASISAGAGVGAAGLAGAGGIAAYEAGKRDQPADIGFSSGSPPKEFLKRASVSSSSGPTGTRTVPVAASKSAAPATQTTGLTGSSASQPMATSNEPAHPSEMMGRPIEEQPESHTGRNAALGAGALGAAGLGAAGYEAHKSHEPASQSMPAPISANDSPGVLPPVSGDSRQALGGLANEPSMSSGVEPPTSESHTGRNAALGAGAGLGAAGLGAAGYEATKSHPDPTSTQSAMGSGSQAPISGGAPIPSSTQYDENEPPVIRTTTNHRLSQSSGSQPQMSQPSEQQHHYGRDAALVGGTGAAGAAGVGAHELGKDRDATTGAAAPSSGTNNSGFIDPYAQREAAATQAPTQAPTQTLAQPSEEHHYGRDAAVAGGAGVGAGALGAGAYEATKDHSSVPATSATTGGPYQTDVMNRADPQVDSGHTEASHALDKEHHYGRDAAVGGGAGAVGVGGYETLKHRDQDPTEQAAVTDSKDKEHHYGRDAAVAGGAGAVGVGGYEALKHHDQDPSEQAAVAESKHNKLHKKDDPRGSSDGRGSEDSSPNKLHKRTDPRSDKYEEEKEKKPSLIHRILHHGDKDKKDSSSSSGPEMTKDGREIEPHTGLPMNVEKYGPADQHIGTDGQIGDATQVSGNPHGQPGDPGIVTEKHTGLPMDVGKYGSSGVGGTDGGPIPGAQQTGVEPRTSGI